MTALLDAAVVGVGTIGERHARLLAEHPETSLRAVVDQDGKRASSVGETYDAAIVTEELADVLSDDEVDVVVIATPERDHLASTREALEHGCHVLLEKPIAETLADARRIGELVDGTGEQLMIAYCCRFDREYAALKEKLKNAEFGSLLGVQAARVGSIESYERAAHWTHPVYYLAVHDIDMLRWYVGEEVERVSAFASSGIGDEPTPAVLSTTIEFPSGTVGTIETNWARHRDHPVELTQEIRLTGTDGYARLVVEDDGVPVTDNTGFTYTPTSECHGRLRGMYRNQLDAFVRCIREGTPPPVTWQDGIQSLAVANAIRESVDREQPVEVTDPL